MENRILEGEEICAKSFRDNGALVGWPGLLIIFAPHSGRAFWGTAWNLHRSKAEKKSISGVEYQVSLDLKQLGSRCGKGSGRPIADELCLLFCGGLTAGIMHHSAKIGGARTLLRMRTISC